MKIIKDAPERGNYWWAGRQVKCHCGCVFELEAADSFMPGPNLAPTGRSIYCPCPKCEYVHTIVELPMPA